MYFWCLFCHTCVNLGTKMSMKFLFPNRSALQPGKLHFDSGDSSMFSTKCYTGRLRPEVQCNPFPFYIPFLTKKLPRLYTFY